MKTNDASSTINAAAPSAIQRTAKLIGVVVPDIEAVLIGMRKPSVAATPTITATIAKSEIVI